jgi:hypothetical protein
MGPRDFELTLDMAQPSDLEHPGSHWQPEDWHGGFREHAFAIAPLAGKASRRRNFAIVVEEFGALRWVGPVRDVILLDVEGSISLNRAGWTVVHLAKDRAVVWQIARGVATVQMAPARATNSKRSWWRR